MSGGSHHGKPSWRWRRTAVFSTLAWCAGVSLFVLARGVDDGLAQTALQSAFTLAGATVGGYVAGAVWDDSIHHSRSSGDGGER